MDLPTYTNIWRIEKRLYKLYDLRLPMPLPLGQIAAFAGITVPYVLILTMIGVPFNHNLFWLYVLPPGVLTWLATRPVLENKKLPELLVSQVRYLGEPNVWCRMAPSAEQDEIVVVGRVWHAGRLPVPQTAAESRRPLPEPVWAAPAPAGQRAPADQRRHADPRPRRAAAAPPRPLVAAAAQAPVPTSQAPAGFGQQRARGGDAPVTGGRAVPRAPIPRERAASRPQRRPARPGLAPAERGEQPEWVNWAAPGGPASRPVQPSRPQVIEVAHAETGRAAARSAGGARRPVLPVAQGAPAHVARPPAGEAKPPVSPAGQAAPARPGSRAPRPAGARRPILPVAQAAAAPAAPAAAAPAAPGHVASAAAVTAADSSQQTAPGIRPSVSEPSQVPAPAAGTVGQPPLIPRHARPAATQADGPGQPASPGRPASPAVPVVTVAHVRGEERPVQSVERALSGPAGPRGRSWNDRVRLVPGGQGPGSRRETEQEERDQARARMPLPGPRKVIVLGCTSGAGQTVTALMTARLLASLRAEPVAALDLNPGTGSLEQRAQSAPAGTVRDLLAGMIPVPPGGSNPAGIRPAGVEVIGAGPGPASVKGLDESDYGRIGDRLAARYRISLIDPGAAAVARVLSIADQLVLVAPASGDAPRAVSMTHEWLAAHDHDGLAAGAVLVVNGVSGRTMPHVEQAEAIGADRFRAVVRVPWEDQLGAEDGPCTGAGPLPMAARHALTALAGLIISGLAAGPGERR